jgi:hypothetical protein
MPHPHQAMLEEFDYAIKHFVPSVPDEVTLKAHEVLQKLQADETADEDAIKNAFHDVGIMEYPHRKAYHDLTMKKAGKRMHDLVLEHVDEAVRKVIQPHLETGVELSELIDSDLMLEQLSPEQRYQVIDGILVAQSKLGDELKDEVSFHTEDYHKLLAKWQAYAEKIDKTISEYVALSDQVSADQKQEMLDRAKRFREGFLVTERDPDMEEIKREIALVKEAIEEGSNS